MDPSLLQAGFSFTHNLQEDLKVYQDPKKYYKDATRATFDKVKSQYLVTKKKKKRHKTLELVNNYLYQEYLYAKEKGLIHYVNFYEGASESLISGSAKKRNPADTTEFTVEAFLEEGRTDENWVPSFIKEEIKNDIIAALFFYKFLKNVIG